MQVSEKTDDRPLVREDVQPGERSHEVRDEERSDDEEEEQVPPRTCPEGDPVHQRIRQNQTGDRRDTRVHERPYELLVVVADPVREVGELPRESEVRKEP